MSSVGQWSVDRSRNMFKDEFENKENMLGGFSSNKAV